MCAVTECRCNFRRTFLQKVIVFHVRSACIPSSGQMLKASQKPTYDKLAPEAKKKGLKAGPNSIKFSPIPSPLVDAEKAIKLKGKKAGMSGQEGDGADLNMRGGKQAGSLLQALAQAPTGKNVASRVRRTTTSSDGAGVASSDRLVSAEGISGNPAGSSGERRHPCNMARPDARRRRSKGAR